MISKNKREEHRITDDQLIETPIVLKGVALFVFMFIIPLESLLKDTLMSWGSSIVYDIQQTRTDSADTFFKYLSFISNNLFLVGAAPALYNLYDPRKSIKLILMWCFSMYLNSLIALIFGEPRPY